MAFSVDASTNRITLTRGDTFRAEVGISWPDGEPYVPEAGETVRFALKSSKMKSGNTDFADERPRIRKEIPISTMLLQLDPADTEGLPFGMYKYDIEITRINGDVDTFIRNADFSLTEEVD